VRWTWASAGHSVTSGTVSGITATPDGKFDSGVLISGATFTHKFDTAGTFEYYCSVHFAAGMTGKIMVTP
jgi:plastocyanin